MPFKKGQSGNPSGKPKTPESIKLAFSGMVPLAIDAIRAILDGTDESAKASDRNKAAEIVFDRVIGKPIQAVDLSGSDGANPLASIKIEFIKPNE